MTRIKKKEKETAPKDGLCGTLYVVATPIGNLEDITLRAIRILREVDLVAAEDTRHTKKLLSHLGISTPLISYYKDREVVRAEQIIKRLQGGDHVALVSDAGTPGLSDPGGILVGRARDSNIPVVPVPGPSALASAISCAGLEETGFLFLGFLPSRSSERRHLLTSLVHEERPLVFYESPRRLPASLKDCLTILGNRKTFWARELTKLHEELRHATLAELVEQIDGQVRGESVLIIEGAGRREMPAFDDLRELLAWYRDNSGLSLKDAVKKITDDLGLSRSQVYKEALLVYNKE